MYVGLFVFQPITRKLILLMIYLGPLTVSVSPANKPCRAYVAFRLPLADLTVFMGGKATLVPACLHSNF